MKKLGCYFYLEKERNKDLIIAFNKLYEVSNTVNAEFYERLSQSPARRFWVSEERAAIVLSRMEHGENLDDMIPSRRRMFHDLYKVFSHLKDIHPSCSVFDLACMAVNSQAPSFYLTPKSMKEIICRIKRKWYDKNNRYRISSPRTNAGNQSSMQPSTPLQEKAL